MEAHRIIHYIIWSIFSHRSTVYRHVITQWFSTCLQDANEEEGGHQVLTVHSGGSQLFTQIRQASWGSHPTHAPKFKSSQWIASVHRWSLERHTTDIDPFAEQQLKHIG